MRFSLTVFCLVFVSIARPALALNKYSKEANQPDVIEESKDIWKDEESPFRLAKINLIWAKAKKVYNCFYLV